jgi:hypothetical protein
MRAKLDLEADRWTPFIHSLVFIGVDLTGAAYAMHVRATKDVSGTPLASLATAAAGAEGVRTIYAGSATIADHIAAARMLPDERPQSFELTDVVMLSEVGIRVNEATMEAMPWPGVRGNDLTAYWDLHVTPSGGVKEVYAAGKFIVRAGATQ